MAELGCAAEYSIWVMYGPTRDDDGKPAVYGGTRKMFAMQRGITSVEWRRRLDDTSDCVITIAKATVDVDCWGQLAKVRANNVEIRLFRDGEAVWEGPVVKYEEDLGLEEDTVILTCHDVSEHLNARFNRVLTPVTAGVHNVAQIARDRIEGSLKSTPELNIVPFMEWSTAMAPVEIQKDQKANSEYLGDLLRTLAGQGLDWTTVGRSMVFGPEATLKTRAQTRLFQSDILTGLRIVEDGLSAATRWVVRGSDSTGEDPPYGVAGGISRYFGLRERAADVWEIRDRSVLTHNAKVRLSFTHPPPVMVQVPDSARLAPQAPVTIRQLVPGVRIDVVVDSAIRPVTGALKLSELHVTWQAGSSGPPESVEVSLVPLGSEYLEPTRESLDVADTFYGDDPVTLDEDAGPIRDS